MKIFFGRLFNWFLFLFIFILFADSTSAMTINFNLLSDTNITQKSALNKAAEIWENLLLDDIILDIDIYFQDMHSTSIIGGSISKEWNVGFNTIKNELNADKTSFADADAISYINSLDTNFNSDLLFWNNGTQYSTPRIVGTQANFKALGYTGFTSSDAEITFNTGFAFDYYREDGIDIEYMDFIGIATHEIGHALGFVSSVDDNMYYNTTFYPTILDLYRHTNDKGAEVVDLSYIRADGSRADGWFSYGDSKIDMSDGWNGLQASHWADKQGLGLMDPTTAWGELLEISSNDLLAFDVIGYEINTVPEPNTILLFGFGLVGLAGVSRKKLQQ